MSDELQKTNQELSLQVVYHKYCKHCTKPFSHVSRNKKYCSPECEEKARKGHRRRAKTRRAYHRNPVPRRQASMSRKQAREFAIAELVTTVCMRCGAVKKVAETEVHHRDGNPFNNDIANLAILCMKCHPKTDIEWREAKKSSGEIPDCRLYEAEVKPVERGTNAVRSD